MSRWGLYALALVWLSARVGAFGPALGHGLEAVFFAVVFVLAWRKARP